MRGKVFVLRSCRPCWRDHPRLCGEKSGQRRKKRRTSGSPPPMRGKALQRCAVLGSLRITPAYAGKSKPQPKAMGTFQDHPRLCGEKLQISSRYVTITGSPPPMRGKVSPLGQGVLHFRITPAYAGKSLLQNTVSVTIKDHPRLCGEKWRGVNVKFSAQGSPPPMRGKELVQKASLCRCRITPAYAGKSQRPHVSLGIIRDHPRLCGEKHSATVIRSIRLGSPPPMRGKASS